MKKTYEVKAKGLIVVEVEADSATVNMEHLELSIGDEIVAIFTDWQYFKVKDEVEL